MWQADPAIARRSLNGEVDAIISGNSDFSVYIGVGGPDGMGDIMLRKPQITAKHGLQRLQSLEIWTGQKVVAGYITKPLETKLSSKVTTTSSV